MAERNARRLYGFVARRDGRFAVEAQRINELIALKEEDRKRRTQEAESPASAAPPSNKQRQSKAKGGKLTRQAREAQLINQMIAVRKRVAENVAAEEERRVLVHKAGRQRKVRLGGRRLGVRWEGGALIGLEGPLAQRRGVAAARRARRLAGSA